MGERVGGREKRPSDVLPTANTDRQVMRRPLPSSPHQYATQPERTSTARSAL